MTPPTEEATLLGELKDPRRLDAAFRKLVSSYGPALHRHLLRMLHSGADTDDVLQNTFVKAYRNLAKFRGDSTAKSPKSPEPAKVHSKPATTWLQKKLNLNSKNMSSNEHSSLHC